MDKRLKLFAISLTSIISATTLGVVAFNFSDNAAFATRAVDAKTTIPLNSNNKPTIQEDGSGLLQYNEHASFSYTGASVSETGHVSLADGGTIYKNEVSNSLKKFTANFTGGSLKLQTGYSDGDVCYEYTLETGIDTLVKGNYFILESEGTTNISNISICFECENEETEGDHNYDSGWTTNETHHWHKSLEDNCVRKDNYAEHTQVDIDMVAPTKETTGSYNGKKCSICDEVLVEPTVLPILSATDYDISYRTAMIDGEVRDSETYIYKEDSTVIFDIGYGDTVYTEYIHAGSSYYSLNRWNELFPAAQATAVDGVLTITLDGNTTVTAESGGALDGQLDLMLYDSVVIGGKGELTIEYSSEIDGVEAMNLEIQEGATVNLIGANETTKTGFKVYGTLQIDGTANVEKYGNAVGFNTTRNDGTTVEGITSFELNIGDNGTLNIDHVGNGINVWNNASASEATSINVNGTLTMKNVNGEGIKLTPLVYLNCNNGSSVSISAQKAGVHFSYGTTNAAAITLNGNAKVTMNISTGSGILFDAQGRVNLRDSSSLEITANSSGIYGFSHLYVGQGDINNHSKNTASLVIHSAGEGNGSTAIGDDGRTKDGNPIQGRAGATYFLFDTTGEVLIEGVSGKTGIHLGGKTGTKNSKVNICLKVLCANMTIKDCGNAIGCWVNSYNNFTIEYSNTGDYSKLKVNNCNNIVNTGASSSIKSVFTSSTCEDVTNS